MFKINLASQTFFFHGRRFDLPLEFELKKIIIMGVEDLHLVCLRCYCNAVL